VNKLTISTVLIKKGKIFQKIFRFNFFREIFITSRVAKCELAVKGHGWSKQLYRILFLTVCRRLHFSESWDAYLESLM
jgi:hypothetical protein